jgi:hypothetical protein
VATLLLGAALLLGACTTASLAREPSEKSVTYAELHGMMVRLAHESAQAGAERQVAALKAPSAVLDGTGTLAANP